ncbi:MAG: type IV pilus modification protein PilV [Gammaproteobacteria bacterium]
MSSAKTQSIRVPGQAHGAHRARGVSLIEILITVLVLAIGLLGLAGLQATSLRNNQGAYTRTQATYLAYEIADAMRANITVARAGGYNLGFGDAPAGGGIVGDDLTAWRDRVIALLPGGEGAISQAGNIFTISVRWDDSRGAEAVQTFAVVTQL